MQPTSRAFKDNAGKAMSDGQLQAALTAIPAGFQVKRAKARAGLPEFEALRDRAVEIKNHTLAHLDLYLSKFEENVKARGGHVHWARDAEEARQIIGKICQDRGAKTVTKGKSMVSEEIELAGYLEQQGLEAVETDLGEYIIQLRGETPSHIIAPAVHLRKPQISETFRKAHTQFDPDRPLTEDRDLLDEARTVLRSKFLAADVGITGANFAIAETGSTVIVTNEGNGDLTQALPKCHIVLTGIEKMVPTMEDTFALIRLLARSATGQEMSCYTTFSTGPKQPGDVDGPNEFHVVLLDNGRSSLLGGDFQDVLRCIRCGACMNHCPIYAAVGGHAYGWVYPGPIGAALNPGLIGIHETGPLPNASTFCGRCEQVCPVRIPLPGLMRKWREKEFDRKLNGATARWALKAWVWAARRPALYSWANRQASRVLRLTGAKRHRWLPLASGWTKHRDMPAPNGATFQQQWRQQAAKRARPS